MSLLSSIYNNNNLEETKYLFISSANRNIGTNSRPIIYLPANLISSQNNINKYLRVSLYNLTINYEWYNVESFNNSISYNNGTTTTTVNIPTGNYSVYEMRDQLNILMPAYVVTYNLNKNAYTFTTSTSGASITSLTARQFLGIENNITYSGTFSSNFIVNMSLYKTLYLNTDLNSGDNNLDNIDTSKVTSSTILDTIPISVAPFDTIYYESDNPVSLDVAVNNSMLTSMAFNLSTDTGDTLDNLAYPWTLTLELKVYNKE
jgi:hypothetical protein